MPSGHEVLKMRPLVGALLLLVVSVAGPSSAPLGAIDWTYLYELFREIEESLEASSTVSEKPHSEVSTSRLPANSEDITWRDIKAEFDRICGQVQLAPTLTDQQLQVLIKNCKKLRQALERSENPQAKILLRRTQMCEDFFEYSLEVRSPSRK